MLICNKTYCADCSIRVYRFFSLSGNMKQTFGRAYFALFNSIMLYVILSKAVVTKLHILLEVAPIMPTLCSLLLHSYYSKNFISKIDTFLTVLLECMCDIKSISNALLDKNCSIRLLLFAAI